MLVSDELPNTTKRAYIEKVSSAPAPLGKAKQVKFECGAGRIPVLPLGRRFARFSPRPRRQNEPSYLYVGAWAENISTKPPELQQFAAIG